MGESRNKRVHNDSHAGNSNKKNKSNNWKKSAFQSFATVIEPGWQGIFATCERKKESRAVGEFYSILEECAVRLYPELNEADGDVEGDDDDIESAIKSELSQEKNKKNGSNLIVSVKLDVECVIFFRLKPPLVPTDMVRTLCESAQQARAGSIRSKFLHRLTPISRTGKATLEGLKEVAKVVLEPHFHSGQTGVKFAIRPTVRNHNTMKRDEIIKTVAACVGPNHIVDLNNYDLLILVDFYKNACGISVVKDFENFKRFNFGQLQINASQVGNDDGQKMNETKIDASQVGSDDAQKLDETRIGASRVGSDCAKERDEVPMKHGGIGARPGNISKIDIGDEEKI